MLDKKWVKVPPHLVDTLSLTRGVYLMISMPFYPTQRSCLAIKLIALVIYIKLGRSPRYQAC
ncbi:SirB2 family protein [Glaciecola sp. SC05]|uniref:SirB2 family protein n=1 Tax=Glaciecola sp. SC05 TaxID=1987355 RepID=UPI003527FADB